MLLLLKMQCGECTHCNVCLMLGGIQNNTGRPYCCITANLGILDQPASQGHRGRWQGLTHSLHHYSVLCRGDKNERIKGGKATPPHTPHSIFKEAKEMRNTHRFLQPVCCFLHPVSEVCALMLLKTLREARVCVLWVGVCVSESVSGWCVSVPPHSAAATASCGPHGSSALLSSSPTAVKTSSDGDRLRSEKMTHSSHKKGTKL